MLQHLEARGFQPLPRARHLPTCSAPSATGGSTNSTSSDTSTSSQPPTFPGAPERDPWSEKHGSMKAGNFEDELSREERELFGGKRNESAQVDKTVENN